uniref:Uncharacterized protein n=1 Tax=Aegilops tauschii TaxID=37682 RepID=N1QTJ8_AEGTA
MMVSKEIILEVALKGFANFFKESSDEDYRTHREAHGVPAIYFSTSQIANFDWSIWMPHIAIKKDYRFINIVEEEDEVTHS